MNQQLEAVQAIYAAFAKGDVPAILDHLADNVAWESWANNFAAAAGVNYMQPRKGKQGAAEFFDIVSKFRIRHFEVLNIMTGGNSVAAEFVIEAEVPGGGVYRDEEMHLWTFNAEGKVSRLRHYADTAKHIAASRGVDTLAGSTARA